MKNYIIPYRTLIRNRRLTKKYEFLPSAHRNVGRGEFVMTEETSSIADIWRQVPNRPPPLKRVTVFIFPSGLTQQPNLWSVTIKVFPRRSNAINHQ